MFGFGKTKKKTDKPSLFAKLKQGLSRTRQHMGSGLANVILGRKTIDKALFSEIETQLLIADVGVEATTEIINTLTEHNARAVLADPKALYDALQTQLLTLLQPCEQPLVLTDQKPFVILMVGVNGAGKTTTIGKLAQRFRAEGKRVMLAAGDTFRAAAVEQLQVWGERNDVPVIAQQAGADSAAVIFDALQAAQARQMDVLIADTAGRLHTKDNLMQELAKVKRVLGKLDAHAPHEVMLVLDASMGQNALQQARQFHDNIGITGITLSKLDGTAKGGIIFALAKHLGLPLRFIGVGETANDLREFAAAEFIQALFAQEDDRNS